MANFATAALVKAQAELIKQFQAGELRFRVPAVHKLFLQNTEIMVPDYKTLRTREDRVVETNYFTRTARGLGSARTHNHTGAQGDSAVLTPSWATYTDKFVSTIKEADNKEYSFDEIHQSKLINVIANFAEGLDTVASAFAFANRTGVNTAIVEGTFDAVDDVFEITESTHGTRAIQITKMVMDINKWQNVPFDIICDSISFNKFQYAAAQGISNATNTSFQFMGVTFVHDPALYALGAALVSAYSKGFWIVIPRGTVCALPWIPRQNREGADHGPIATYGSIENQIDMLQYAIHTYKVGSDGTALGGYTQDVTIETEISIDLAYDNMPLSTASATSLFAFALV